MWKFSVKEWIGKYLYFSKATLCIRGLVLSHSLVNHVVISVLITYLAYELWDDINFPKAAIVINLINGFSSLMVFVLVCISRKLGPLKVIVSTNTAYVLGLVLLWVTSRYLTEVASASHPAAEKRARASQKIFYGAALLLAIGEAGRLATLDKFLNDQYSDEVEKLPERQNSEAEEGVRISTQKRETRQSALWSHAWFLGAAAPLALINRSWPTQLLLSMIAMTVSYLFFWCGVPLYKQTPGGGNWWKFWLKPDSQKHYYKEMLFVCLAFVVYSMVEATGSTFFFDQMYLMDNHIGKFRIPSIYFVVLQSSASAAISFGWRQLVPKKTTRTTLIRIGCGLICSVLSVAAAWRAEIRKTHEIDTQYIGLLPKPESISMHTFWLIPQFSLLGFMRGLAGNGLIDFFVDRVVNRNGKEKARYYGLCASQLVFGIGTVLTAISIVGLRRNWLVVVTDKYDVVDDDYVEWEVTEQVYVKHLDKYYRALVFMGVANLCYYFGVASSFFIRDDNSQVTHDGGTEDEQSEIPDKEMDNMHNYKLPPGGPESSSAGWPDVEDTENKI